MFLFLRLEMSFEIRLVWLKTRWNGWVLPSQIHVQQLCCFELKLKLWYLDLSANIVFKLIQVPTICVNCTFISTIIENTRMPRLCSFCGWTSSWTCVSDLFLQQSRSVVSWAALYRVLPAGWQRWPFHFIQH